MPKRTRFRDDTAATYWPGAAPDRQPRRLASKFPTAARARRRGDRVMKRREFITLLSGAAAWPLAASAQQGDRMRIGVFTPLAEDDPVDQARIAAFLRGLQHTGWTDGRNVRIDYHWSAGDDERVRKYAAELVALAPGVILASGSATVGALRATRTIPIVFPIAVDPVGAGFVESLARPGGNATGFLTASAGNGWSCSKRSRPS